MAVGFVPFTRNALSHKKVCHILGEGEASVEMTAKLKETQQNYNCLKREAKQIGLNDFVFDVELPVHKKSALLQKTENEQVKSLVERKSAFSAGGIWMALGFQLMGSQATVRVQLQQIELEKAAAARTTAKKAKDLRVKVEKAESSFQLYKSSQHTQMEAWRDIIKFLMPIYDKKTAPSKINSIKKATDKLNSFEAEYGSKWDDLMEIQLRSVQTKQPPADTDVGNEVNNLQAQLRLETTSDGENNDCDDEGDEAGV
mmetsp:Transcript_5727/g.11705  ORF Transcript_5727/g.11705 Transcript_5727/m.11705 type:complete len:257 (+) Transcript_5727:481-1251(+)